MPHLPALKRVVHWPIPCRARQLMTACHPRADPFYARHSRLHLVAASTAPWADLRRMSSSQMTPVACASQEWEVTLAQVARASGT